MSDRASSDTSLDELVQATRAVVASIRELVPRVAFTCEALHDLSTASAVEREDGLVRVRRLVADQDDSLDLLLARIERLVSAQLDAETALAGETNSEASSPNWVRRTPL